MQIRAVRKAPHASRLQSAPGVEAGPKEAPFDWDEAPGSRGFKGL